MTREYQHANRMARPGECEICGRHIANYLIKCLNCWAAGEQTAICTNDDQCQAAADEHNPDCPIEQSLQDEFGGF